MTRCTCHYHTAFDHGSVPEPEPVKRGEPVTPALLAWLESIGGCEAARVLILERDAYGRTKYAQPLMSDDGRNSVEDARQEAGDLLQYVFKARMNGEDLGPIRALLPVLVELLREG